MICKIALTCEKKEVISEKVRCTKQEDPMLLEERKRERLRKENEKKEEILARVKRTRGSLIDLAKDAAVKLAQEFGKVSSTDVLMILESDHEIRAMMRGKDKRFMGAVFASGKMWTRVGYESTGSHGRPVAVWRLRPLYRE